MLIGTKFKIESDNLNVTLSRKRKRTHKDTKETYEAWEIMGYFATVGGALHELVNQGVRDTKLTDLKSIVAKIDKLHNLIEHSL